MREKEAKKISGKFAVSGQQVKIPGAHDGLCAAMQVELAIDVSEMPLDGTDSDHHVLRDFPVRHPGSKQAQYLYFAFAERLDRRLLFQSEALVGW